MSMTWDGAGEMEGDAATARQLAKAGGRAEGPIPAEKKKAKASSKRGRGRPSRDALAAELSAELAKVRSMLKESGENLLTRLDGELVTLARYLSGQGLPDEKPVLPPAEALSEMILQARALKVKPHKGRVKDLARIQGLLETLASGMPPGA